MLEKTECPKCKKLISIKDKECPYCGIILNKYTNLKPSKSFYSSSYKDISIAEELKEELKQYHSLSMIEKTQLIAKAKKYDLLDLASYYINSKTNDISIDNELIFNLSKLNLKNKKSYYQNFSKPLLFSISILIAIILIFIFI